MISGNRLANSPVSTFRPFAAARSAMLSKSAMPERIRFTKSEYESTNPAVSEANGSRGGGTWNLIFFFGRRGASGLVSSSAFMMPTPAMPSAMQ